MPNLHRLLLTIYLYAAGMDYRPVSRSLIFNASITTQMVEVPIVDDHIVEHSEIINLTLVSTDSAVILNPSTSTITIEDVDSKLHTVCRSPNIWVQFILFTTLVVTIGFNKTAYSASEDASSVSITLSVEIGALDQDVVVTLSSINGTAVCKFLKQLKSTIAASMLIFHSLISSAGEEYTPVSTNVTFNATASTHTVNIPILDNEIVAGSTMFTVSLTSADPAAILNPASADITIEDDDSEKPWIWCM